MPLERSKKNLLLTSAGDINSLNENMNTIKKKQMLS
jgi:hypothetical protein